MDTIDTIIYGGKLLLESGSEAYRAKELMNKCLAQFKITNVSIIVLTHQIVYFVGEQNIENQRVVDFKIKGINLTKISQFRYITKNIHTMDITIERLKDMFDKANEVKSYSKYQSAVATGLAGAGFCGLKGGTIIDVLISFMIGALSYFVMNTINKNGWHIIIRNMIVSFCGTLLATIIYACGLGNNLDLIFIGCIMFMAPGVALTNAVRDIFHKELILGLKKAKDATLSAVGISIGVGFVIYITSLVGVVL